MSSPALALRSRMPRLAGAALERARLTVVPRTRRRSSPVPFVLLVSMVAVGGIVGLLLFNTSMQQASFAATSLQQEADTLTAREQSLQMQVDRLNDPQTIALRAQRMGMVLPTSPAVLDLRTGKVLGDPTPATRQAPLRLLPPDPVKPASINPAPTIVQGHTGGKHHGTGHHRRGDDVAGTRRDHNLAGNTGHGSRHGGHHTGRTGTGAGD